MDFILLESICFLYFRGVLLLQLCVTGIPEWPAASRLLPESSALTPHILFAGNQASLRSKLVRELIGWRGTHKKRNTQGETCLRIEILSLKLNLCWLQSAWTQVNVSPVVLLWVIVVWSGEAVSGLVHSERVQSSFSSLSSLSLPLKCTYMKGKWVGNPENLFLHALSF